VPPPDVVRSRAEALLDLSRWTEAERLLGQLVSSEPDDARAHCLLALALDGQRRDEEMLEAANRAVALAPDDEWGHRLASIALVRLDLRDEAARAAAEAVRLDPFSWRAHLQYAVAAHTVPRLAQDAHSAALRAAEIAPEAADVHFALGLTSEATGRHEEVAGHYRDAVRLNPSHAGALNNLTNLQGGARLGRKAQGYLAALRADPGSTFARTNLEGLAGRFALRVLGLCVVALLLCAVEASARDLAPHFSWARACIGLLLVLVVVGYTRALVGHLPLGARTHLLARIRGDGTLLTAFVLAGGGLALAVLACFAPFGGAVAVAALRPVGILAVVVVVRLGVRRVR